MKTPPVGDGLDFSSMDTITQEEVDAFHNFYTRTKGAPIPALEFWLEFRPGVLKRFRHCGQQLSSAEEASRPLPRTLGLLHYYSIVGFEDGILYEIRLAQSAGATKAELLDTLAVAFIHGLPLGGRYVATSSTEYLRTYQDPDNPGRWPQSWSFDPDAFRSGVDFSNPVASKDDLDKIQDWYQTVMGEVPRYIRFLAEHRPRYLKAHRNRFENAIQFGLPKQMMPFLLLQYAVSRGFRDAIRQGVLFCKSFGLTKAQIIDAICGSLYGGLDAIGIADEAAGDILRQME